MKTIIIAILVLALGAGSAYVVFSMVKNSKVDIADIQNRSGAAKSKTAVEKYSSYKKPGEKLLREQLTDEQYYVTQQEGTEYSFDNEYWDNKREGIYVDILSGEPLFSSVDKFKSGTGWPSFTQPIEPELIVLTEDYHLLVKRVEVRSRFGDNHLGHVFNDGPLSLEESGGAEPTGLRYCMNSAALRFIAREDMEKEGYGEYLSLFEKSNDKNAEDSDQLED